MGAISKANMAQEPEGEVVQPAVSTSTQPQPLAPTTTTYITQTPVGNTINIPASTSPQTPALPKYPPPRPPKLKQDTIQPADFPDNITHLPRQLVQQPVRIRARPLNERTTYHCSSRSNTPHPPTHRPATPSIPTRPAATLASKQIASEYARPSFRVSNSTNNRRRRSPTLGEPIEGETWPDAPKIEVSNFKLARSLPQRPPKHHWVRGTKPMICDNAGCSGCHSHDSCSMPRQCKGCGSLDHFWTMCNRRCNLCGAERHTKELCFTIPVGEDMKSRSGNLDGYRQGFFCEPQSRGPASQDRDPFGRPGGRLPRSGDRDSRRRPEDRTIRPEDQRPWAKRELGSLAYEDRHLSGRLFNGRTPGHDDRDQEEPWGQGGPYLESDQRYGRIGRHDVHGRKRSADMRRGESARSAPAKRRRVE